MKKLISILAGLCFVSVAFADDFSVSKQDLWPEGKMPGPACGEQEVAKTAADGVTRISFVSKPTLEFYIPKSRKPTGAVIISPGGGYSILAYNLEGQEIAEWLAKEGIAAVILKYRVPNNREGALMDLQRAIRTVRAKASELNIDPSKIAVMGFSAGANLSARASTLYATDSYRAIDEIDKVSARPDFTCLIYPAYCDEPTFQQCWGNKQKRKHEDFNSDYRLASELKIDSKTPPAFIVQTQDDSAWINSSIAYYLALKEANVPSCLHIFDSGGHGYGIRDKAKLVNDWNELCEDWLKSRGF